VPGCTQAEKTVEHFGKFCGEYHLLWKVKDFRRCYEEGATQAREVIYSPAFDTHRNGYKLQLSICPAGDGKGRQPGRAALSFASQRRRNDFNIAGANIL